jgi:2-keto-4-pentenoate hydratase/2-oxohepta-3-ene-1,7-dioic acid hydratase in catechol pathway
MRICRFNDQDGPAAGFYSEDHVIPVTAVAELFTKATGQRLSLPQGDNLLDLLPPDGHAHQDTKRLAEWAGRDNGEHLPTSMKLPTNEVSLLIPVPRPNKLFLLAGNYAKHIEEGGGVAALRSETFPYVFMKPPTTTLVNPGHPIHIPAVSPDHIDWELELAVVIGRRAKGVTEADALHHVAGYTIVNDISDREFHPNPQRKPRAKDGFFDWLHGKWHDSFCPCGPCIASVDTIADPQKLKLELRVNGQLRQDSSTANQIFPVAAVVEFISSFVTLEPGDIISTGTPSGVGHTVGEYLQPGDHVEARISSIGSLKSPVVA